MIRLPILLLFSLLVACAPQSAQAQSSSPLENLFGPPRAATDSGPAATTPRQAPRSFRPGETVSLRQGRRHLELVDAPRLQELYNGGLYHQCEKALFFITGSGENTSLSIMNISDGQVFGAIARPQKVTCAGSYAFITTAAMPWVVHLDRKETLELRYTLPNGRPISDSHLFPLIREGETEPGEVLVYTRDQNNQKFIGRWAPGAGPSISLTDSPFGHIRKARYIGDLIQIDSSSHNSSWRGSALFYLDDRGLHLFEEEGIETIEFLENGFTTFAKNFSAGFLSPQGDVTPVERRECRFSPSLIATSDVGALFVCLTHDLTVDYFFYLDDAGEFHQWEQRLPFQRGGTNSGFRLRPGYTTIYEFNNNMPRSTLRYEPVGFWFDLRQGVNFHGTPLFAIPTLGFRGMPAHFLATSVDAVEGRHNHSIELHAIDLDLATEEYLHTYQDCPGFLRYAGSQEGRFLIQCLLQPEPGRFRFRYQWSELIDLNNNTRWRETNRRFEAFTSSGQVILSNVSSGQDHVYAPARRLWIY